MSQRYIGGLIYNPPGGFSGYFDGSGDYLDAGTNAALGFGTGDFTVEAWIYRNASGTFPIYTNGPASSGSWAFYVFSDKLQTDYYGGTSLAGATSIPLNTWNHVAVVRSGSTLSIYLNGNRDATTTTSSNNTTSNGVVGRDWTNGSGSPNGYMSNFRVVKGTAVYSGTSYTVPTSQLQAISGTSLLTCAYPTFRDGSSNNFTITVNGNTAVSTQNPFPQTQLPNPALGNQGNGVYSMSQYQALRSQNLWPAIDPYFDYVTLMLHGNGTNGAQNNTFLDSSTNNFTITRNGNTTQGTFTPYGSNWGVYFPSTPNTYLSTSGGAATAMGTGDFTWECWVYVLGASAYQDFIDTRGNVISGSSDGFAFALNTGTLTPMIYTTGILLSSSINITANAWNHVAVTRSGTTLTLWVNGASGGSTTNSTNLSNQSLSIGSANTTSVQTNGYISNVRMVKGTALYTSAFTPSTAPLTAISGTSLLTCQSNRFIDNSSNAFAITVTGSPSVQRFSPFAPTTPYAAGTIGGSGYFDGSGDYLSGPNNAAFAFGTGDFTIEAWVNSTNYSGTNAIFDTRSSGNESTGVILYIRADGKPEMYRSAAVVTGSTALSQNTWNHVALTRSGSTCTLWLNGVSIGTATDATNLTQQNSFVGAAYTGVNNLMVGYIANLRVVKGTAVYTSTFTPPSAPLTNITNTSLLLNFTNGGIIDNAMMNDLETVGNAQISTSVSKFGGGSIAFDGSGDILSSPGSQNYVFNGDFTVEGWVYIDSTMASSRPDNLKTFIFVGWNTGNTPQLYVYGTTSTPGIGIGYYDGTTAWEVAATVPKDQWAHIAYARIGSALYGFVNGVRYTINASISATIGSANTFVVGGNPSQINSYFSYLKGNIDDLRITRGYARYTANFTPQRSQWQDQ